MPEDLISSILIPLIPVAIALGGVTYKVGDWVNKKAEKKASDLKTLTESKERDLRNYTEIVAKDMRILTETKATELRGYTAEIAKEIRETNEKQITELRDKLNQLDSKIEKTYQRADLVNGNVSNIRTDIADLQEDILELYSADDVEYEQEDNGKHTEVDKGRGRDAVSARKNRKRTELNRRMKRRQIETDRVSQSERREERAYRDSRDSRDNRY